MKELEIRFSTMLTTNESYIITIDIKCMGIV